MALVVADRVQETTTTSGTGTLSLAGAVAGYQSFVSGVGSGNTTYYTIYDQIAQVWEPADDAGRVVAFSGRRRG